MPSRWAWLFDVGSTFTKATAVDIEDPSTRFRAQSPTTIESGVQNGLDDAVTRLEALPGAPRVRDSFCRLAASSAAGGLSLAVCGLVPRLSLEAGRLVALGAGARLVGQTSHRISPRDLQGLEEERPDIVLLVGGTDGGNRAVLTENAEIFARSGLDSLFVVAGNAEVNSIAMETLVAGGKKAFEAANVLPELGVVAAESARGAIRNLFMTHIVQAKGIGQIEGFVDAPIVPTPSAVLDAVGFLSQHVWRRSVMAVEIGGATTDVHSHLVDDAVIEGRVRRGLVEPNLKRTVEGDLGMRWNAVRLAALVDPAWCDARNHAHTVEDLSAYAKRVENSPRLLPHDDWTMSLDRCLAEAAMTEGLVRHCGWVESKATLEGRVDLQYGKDFRKLEVLIGSGGVFAHNVAGGPGLDISATQRQFPEFLLPQRATVLVDQEYLLSAIGLLAAEHPQAAEEVARSAFAD